MISNKIIGKIFLSIAILYMYGAVKAMDIEVHFQKKKFVGSYNKLEAFDQNNQRIGDLLYYSELNDNSCVLVGLKVLEEEQKKGIGSQLFLMLLHEANAEGRSEVRWNAYEKAVPFYQRFGAKIFPRSSDLVHMEFNFERDGNPEENLKKYYANKSKQLKSKIMTLFSYLISYYDW